MARVGTWTLRLEGPDEATDKQNQDAYDDFLNELGMIEEELSMEVPDGYYVKIENA